jgi:hypothetical protein
MKKVIMLIFVLALAGSAFAKREQPAPIGATRAIVKRAVDAVPALRDTMKDPDSFVLESVSIVTRGNHVPNWMDGNTHFNDNVICFGFRSKNGYGGYGHESAMLLLEGDGGFLADRGTRGSLLGCNAGKFDAITDLTAEVKTALQPPPPQAQTPEEKAKQAQDYADCLKVAVNNPSIVCKAPQGK